MSGVASLTFDLPVFGEELVVHLLRGNPGIVRDLLQSMEKSHGRSFSPDDHEAVDHRDYQVIRQVPVKVINENRIFDGMSKIDVAVIIRDAHPEARCIPIELKLGRTPLSQNAFNGVGFSTHQSGKKRFTGTMISVLARKASPKQSKEDKDRIDSALEDIRTDPFDKRFGGRSYPVDKHWILMLRDFSMIERVGKALSDRIGAGHRCTVAAFTEVFKGNSVVNTAMRELVDKAKLPERDYVAQWNLSSSALPHGESP